MSKIDFINYKLNYKSMRRIIYLLLALTLFACQNEVEMPATPTIEFSFGKIRVTSHHTSAAITADLPSVKINGGYDHNAKLTLCYHEKESLDCSIEIVDEYELLLGEVRFILTNLKPDTTYSAYLSLESSTGEIGTSEQFEFVTEQQISQDGIGCKIIINSNRGLFASVNISNIKYTKDSVDVALESLRFEYRLYNNAQYPEWSAIEFGADEIADGSVKFDLPGDDNNYLAETRTYEYVIVLVPEDDSYGPYTLGDESHNYRFEMGRAEISANISTPQLTINDGVVSVDVERVDIFYDGVSADYYQFANPTYSIRYRIKGIDNWTQVIFTQRTEDGGLNESFSVQNAEPNTVYEVVAAVYAGNSHTLCYSEIAEICVE